MIDRRVSDWNLQVVEAEVFILVVSQFRVCILWRTRPLWSSKASPSETLLTSSAVVKCDGLVSGAFPGSVTRCFTLTSRFLPLRPAKVTIYAMWCRHFPSFFLLFRARENLWLCEAMKDHSDASFVRRCDVIGLQMLRRMQTLDWDTAEISTFLGVWRSLNNKLPARIE